MEMETVFDEETDFQIDEQTLAWTVRLMTALKNRLSINIELHCSDDLLEDGQIFLFNHFARFETFIPQFLFYLKNGTHCRSIAAHEFFRKGDTFSNYLMDLGAVPNNHPRLLPFLAEESLRGRKVIIFPEGGMVKDRSVIDSDGDYSVYSRTADNRRKHHTGAAVLGQTLDAFKVGIQELDKAGEREHLERWVRILKLGSVETLLAAARQPTLIVPANITFYPIRVSSNILQRGADFFAKKLSRKMTEELLIEGNILLKDTDMDIRMTDPVRPSKRWRIWDRLILRRLVRRASSMDELFVRGTGDSRGRKLAIFMCIGRHVRPLRDLYMKRMYDHVTLNLSHLASRLIMKFVERGETEMDAHLFHKILYIAIKNAQKKPSIHLHHSLLNPESYYGVIDGNCKGLEQFMSSEACSELIQRENGRYRFLPKLKAESKFDTIRLENLIAVYANEMAPITDACEALDDAIEAAHTTPKEAFATMMFDDELLSYQWDRKIFSKPEYEEINTQETATESGQPFLLMPEKSNGVGIVLAHGFLASPAEVRGFAEKLLAAGHPVIGVRLKGHGTSPWDLRDRNWKNWQMPIRKGYRIMAALTGRVALVGFSSGGALSLIYASEHPEKLAGVAVISAQLKFRNKNLIFVPLIHGANKVAQWLPYLEGVMPFRVNESEHPRINYRNMAIRGLYELRRMVDKLKNRLGKVECPVLIVQGDEDTVVDPKSADLIYQKLGSRDKTIHMVPSKRHGILNEDIGDTHDAVLAFAASLVEGRTREKANALGAHPMSAP